MDIENPESEQRRVEAERNRERQELARIEAEKNRRAAEEVRHTAEQGRAAAEDARQAAVGALRDTAEALSDNLEQMKALEEIRRTHRDLRDVTARRGD